MEIIVGWDTMGYITNHNIHNQLYPIWVWKWLIRRTWLFEGESDGQPLAFEVQYYFLSDLP